MFLENKKPSKGGLFVQINLLRLIFLTWGCLYRHINQWGWYF